MAKNLSRQGSEPKICKNHLSEKLSIATGIKGSNRLLTMVAERMVKDPEAITENVNLLIADAMVRVIIIGNEIRHICRSSNYLE